MFVLSSMHVHPGVQGAGQECLDCANHVSHPGHLSTLSAPSHDCVLCQFFSLSFLPAPNAACDLDDRHNNTMFADRQAALCLDKQGIVGLRAPPVILF